MENADILNLSTYSSLITDPLNNFVENLCRHFPDIIILHFGINEAAPRFLPRFIWRLIYDDKNKYALVPPLKSLVLFLRNVFNLITYIYLKIVGGKDRGWISTDKFEYIYSQLIGRIEKELKSKTIIINIGSPNKSLEKALPWIKENIERLNSIMAKIAHRSESVFLIDAHRMCVDYGIDRIRPDGVHFNSEGHYLLAKEIFSLIQQISNTL